MTFGILQPALPFGNNSLFKETYNRFVSQQTVATPQKKSIGLGV
jgi:hypothetical protein